MGALNPKGLRIGGSELPGERARRIQRGSNVELLKIPFEFLAGGIGAAQHRLGLTNRGELPGIQGDLADGVDRGQRQQRNVELVYPLLYRTVCLRRKALS